MTKQKSHFVFLSFLWVPLALSLHATAIQSAPVHIPFYFEKNEGQALKDIHYLSRAAGYQLFLLPTQIKLHLPQNNVPSSPAPDTTLRIEFLGASPVAQIKGIDPMPGKSHYLIGQQKKDWNTHIPLYAKVKYKKLYPGIDMVFYGNNQNLEYDFILSPKTKPEKIRMKIEGAQDMKLDAAGNMIIRLGTHPSILLQKPILYQKIKGEKKSVEGGFIQKSPQEIGFWVGSYDVTQKLIIDPTLVYSNFLTLSEFEGGHPAYIPAKTSNIAVDAAGMIYLTGTVPFSAALQGTPAKSSPSNYVFLMKLNPSLAGQASIVYQTFFGGEAEDRGQDIAIDQAGNIYITGFTYSQKFFTTPGAFQAVATPALPTTPSASSPTIPDPNRSAFVTKINPLGTNILYSTYLGPDGDTAGQAIAVDASGNMYVVGVTNSAAVVPNMPRAYMPKINATSNTSSYHGFVLRLNAAGTSIDYASYLGTPTSSTDVVTSIVLDQAGKVYIAGAVGAGDFQVKNPYQATYGGGSADVFVAKMDFSQTGEDSLLYATYLGGDAFDQATGIAIDSANNIWVTGYTSSSQFPITSCTGTSTPCTPALAPNLSGWRDMFVTKLNANGDSLLYSTYLPSLNARPTLSAPDEFVYEGVQGNIVVDKGGNAYVTGFTESSHFPVKNPPTSHSNSAPQKLDGFLIAFDSTGASLYSFLFGDGAKEVGNSLALDQNGNIYISGFVEEALTPSGDVQQGTTPTFSSSFVVEVAPLQNSVESFANPASSPPSTGCTCASSHPSTHLFPQQLFLLLGACLILLGLRRRALTKDFGHKREQG